MATCEPLTSEVRMWSYFRGDFIIPLITSWPEYDGNGVLPIEPHENFFRLKMHGVQGNLCKRFKAISTGGQVDDLCTFCKHSIARFINPNKVCKFSYDKNKTSYYGWNEDDLGLLVGTLEIPVLAIAPNPDIKPELKKLRFNLKRIIHNLRHMLWNYPHYATVKDDVSVNYYATRTTTIRAHSKDSWFYKIKLLLTKLENLDESTFQKRIQTLDI